MKNKTKATERKTHEEPRCHAIFKNGTEAYVAFKTVHLCSIVMLSPEQTKQLMVAFYKFVMGKGTEYDLAMQLDITTRIVFGCLVVDLKSEEGN